MARNTIAYIDPAAVAHNLDWVRSRAPGSRVMAVVKADAYGHRIDLCLPALKQADMLAVATLEEARAIRRLGNGLPVVLLEGISRFGDLAVADDLHVELMVHHESQLDVLERYGRVPAGRVWLKIDTGMHRLGIAPEKAERVHRRLQGMKGVEQISLVSHLACAENPTHPLTRRQVRRFNQLAEVLGGQRCLVNSAGLINVPQAHFEWVRAGLVLYGISPLSEQDGRDIGLQPAMTLTAELIAVNTVKAGESIGYGARFVADRDMKVGVASIGYGDGYPRHMPDGAPVQIGGRPGRLAGRVSMDMITIDLRDCPEARIGDPVVVWGSGVPIEKAAALAGTIPYELSCRITRRVRFKSGAPVFATTGGAALE